MAGNPQPASRRSPPPTTQADSLASASRGAAAADWGVPPKKSGIRGEIKLALMLIITLAGAFGYIVHRKFADLRKEVSAAEGESFAPLKSAGDPRSEITLPPAEQSDPESANADPLWAQHDLSQQTASADPPPLLSLQQEPSQPQPESTDPFPAAADPQPKLVAESAAGNDAPSQLPFPDFAAQSEPAPIETDGKAWSPIDDSAAPTAKIPFADQSSVAFGAEPNLNPAEPATVDTAPFPGTGAPQFPAAEEAIPFAPAESPAVTAAAPAEDAPLNLFGPFPTTPEAAVPVEPTFEPAVTAFEPAFSDPAPNEPELFAPPRDDVTFTPEPLPNRTPAPKPVIVEPNWEPTPSAPGTVTPRGSIGSEQEPLMVSEEPFVPTIRQQQPAPASIEPLFTASPTLPPAESDPFGGPTILPQQDDARNDPVPAPPGSQLNQSIPTFAGPERASTLPTQTPRAVDSASPTWPEPAPTPLRQPSLFENRPVPENTAFIPDHGSAPPSAGSDDLYTIRPGDNYWLISKAHYGSVRYFAALTEYNRDRVADPQKMKPGMQVVIPDATVLESRYPELFTGTVPSVAATRPTVNTDGPGQFFVSAGEPMYRVGQGDTLSSIAQKHLGRASRWEQVYTMNRDVLPGPDRLKPGTVLHLPRDASQIAVTPEGSPGR